MKWNIGIKILLVFLICFALFSCDQHLTNNDQENNNPLPGRVLFSFNHENNTTRETISSVIVSIEDENGNIVYDTFCIELYNMGSSYISEPLALESGLYQLTLFFVVDDSNNVLYATPIEGSPNAYLVDNPLPIGFEIIEDAVTTLIPEVIDTSGMEPEDFGYSSFSFEIIETFEFLICIFIYNGNVLELTTAELEICSQGSVIFTGNLAAITNNIIVNDNYNYYELTVMKTGYNNYTQVFSNEDLKLYSETPLIVTLFETQSSVYELQPGPLEGKDAEIWNLPCNTAYAQYSGLCMNVNEGDMPYIRAATWTYFGDEATHRSFIEFDLSFINNSCVIDSAFLYLYSETSSGQYQSGENEFYINRVSESWDEHTVIWNNQPDVISSNLLQDQVLVPQSTCSNQDYIINITEMVTYWIENPADNLGMRLSLCVEETYRRAFFASSDYANPLKRPKLIIYISPIMM